MTTTENKTEVRTETVGRYTVAQWEYQAPLGTIFYLNIKSPQHRGPLAGQTGRFTTEQKRADYLAWWKGEQEKKKANAQAKIEAKRTARANFVNPYTVGQVLYGSWGYDQTNIDFYEVVKVGARSIVVRELAQNLVTDEGCGPMSGKVTPKAGEYIGEAKQVNLCIRADGSHHINSPKHGYLYEFDGRAKHCSWYA